MEDVNRLKNACRKEGKKETSKWLTEQLGKNPLTISK